jgi:hypothetical protein
VVAEGLDQEAEEAVGAGVVLRELAVTVEAVYQVYYDFLYQPVDYVVPRVNCYEFLNSSTLYLQVLQHPAFIHIIISRDQRGLERQHHLQQLQRPTLHHPHHLYLLTIRKQHPLFPLLLQNLHQILHILQYRHHRSLQHIPLHLNLNPLRHFRNHLVNPHNLRQGL